MITLKNEVLTVKVKSFGAELSSMVANQTGREYIWQGDPTIWSGQAPILFPITGRLLQDRFTFDGDRFFLPKHGFARKSAFSVVSTEATKAIFSLSSSPETHRVYPFDFRLEVAYALSENTLTVTHTVYNTDTRDIYFSLGAHPAFRLTVGDQVNFAEYENFKTCLFDENGLLCGEKDIAHHQKSITITEDLFDHDALFFPGLQSTSAKIVEQSGKEILEMSFDKVPFLGLWAKPGAPFVCIEPWYGIPDTPEVTGALTEKPFINSLTSNSAFSLTYSVKIL